MTEDPPSTAGDEIALADTSMFVAREQGRLLAADPPAAWAVSTVTIGELRLGVLTATDGSTRARRLETLSVAMQLEPLGIDQRIAHAWAALRLALRDSGRRMPVNDSWIAATAIASNLTVATQDGDYDGVPGLRVLRL